MRTSKREYKYDIMFVNLWSDRIDIITSNYEHAYIMKKNPEVIHVAYTLIVEEDFKNVNGIISYVNCWENKYALLLCCESYNKLYVNGTFVSNLSPLYVGVLSFDTEAYTQFETEYLNNIDRWAIKTKHFLIVIDHISISNLLENTIEQIISDIITEKNTYDGMVFQCEGAFHIFESQDSVIYEHNGCVFISQLTYPYNICMHKVKTSRILKFYEDSMKNIIYGKTKSSTYMFSA